MNPAWIPAICAVVGLLGNAGWGLYNLGQKTAIERERAATATEIAGFKEWIAHEYVCERMCAVRMEARA
jgi:hypothetical protein